MLRCIEETPHVRVVFENMQSQLEECQRTSIPILLNHLLRNAERNCDKVPQQRRHEKVLTKFAVSLFLYSGPMAYAFIEICLKHHH